LPLGAYVLQAETKGITSREIILVTDSTLIVKTSQKQALVYFCNALDGSPIQNAPVKLWERSYDGRKWVWQEMMKDTNRDGICLFDLNENKKYSSGYNREFYVAASVDDRQAFSIADIYNYSGDRNKWRIYAFCDRPAYRPEEEVQWKFIARQYNESVYTTPANQVIEFQINDPRGTKVYEDKVKLNSFGSAWGLLELNKSMPLGEYKVTFRDERHKNYIGEATLFRLEEYKLPEFKVGIETPQEDGKERSFILGDEIEVNIQANYYFGGPVANANVEVLVYQDPFYHVWRSPHDYPWFYEDMYPPRRSYYGGGQIIKREMLKTDATGKATVVFETPRNAGGDFEYRIEARVTDASRREIIASNTVRVTRQSYYVYLTNKHNLYRPQDKVEIDIKALDANNKPVSKEGTIKVARDYWFEIWIDSDGKEISGDELKRIREECTIFPPPPTIPNGKPWKLKFRGYEHDDILTHTIKTDAKGEAEFSFTPEREGYYRIAWNSRDRRNTPIRTDTTVWVATNSTTDLGYRHGSMEIIIDKDTFKSGQNAPVMLSVPASDRYVLFSVEGDDLYSYRLVHLTGNVKLIELQIEEKHVPNIFLSAVMINDRQLFMDTKQVVVPPVKQFLEVEVNSNQEQYQPRENGTLAVSILDHKGRPVSAEVALGLVDESVYYIQKDYAIDPRQFYYGTKRRQLIRTQSTLNQKSYTKLIEGDDKLLVDERVFQKKDAYRSYTESAARELRGNKNGIWNNHKGVGRSIEGGSFAEEEKMEMNSVARNEKHWKAKTPVSSLKKKEKAIAPGEKPSVQVRSDFRSTIFWQPGIVTDNKGKAEVNVKFADSLTSWKATARVAASDNQFGIASAVMRTKKPLIVRLQAPRFFVVGDKVTISAVINNNTDEDMDVTPTLDVEGLSVEGIIKPGLTNVAANGESRIDWLVSVENPGEAKLKVTADGNKYADAMEKSYPVYEHGMEKFLSKSGKMRTDEITVKLDIPKERKAESTTLTVQVTPSMAVTMLDALPYLVDYPYGCTEQTMSRFLPAAITAKTFNGLGVKPQVVMSGIFGGIEQEHVDKTHRQGKQDLNKLDNMINKGLNRLYDFQHDGGGWGWWKKGESDHFMTAYVIWGLTLALDSGIDVKRGVLDRGINYLDKEIVEEEINFDMQAWMLHALSTYHALTSRNNVGKFQAKAFDNLWENKDRLNSYTRSLLALSTYNYGYRDKAKTLIRNLINGVKIDKAPDTSIIQRGHAQSHEAVIGTAHWGEDGIYRRWSDGGVEATAFALLALLTIDPQNELIGPVTNWLIKNRRGAQWSNTRDTAITILSLNKYLKESGELESNIEFELLVNDKVITRKKITPEEVFSAPSSFTVPLDQINDGTNTIHLKRIAGNGHLYFAAHAKYFSLEEPISPAGNEIFVRRQYYKLVGRPTLLKGYVYEKQPLNDGETIKSGERVETVITIEAKNNYEYLVFEDLKPAGLEAVQIRSGEALYTQELKSGVVKRLSSNDKKGPDKDANIDTKKAEQMKKASRVSNETIIVPGPAHDESSDYTGRTRWVYQELRDRKVALFIDKLPEGVWEVRYDLRAEVPGRFHALPVVGYAMYVPEVRTNGSEVRINVGGGD